MAVKDNPWMRDHLSARDGNLFIEECGVADLATQFGTPLYVVSETRLRQNYRLWADTLAELWTEGPTRVLPSVKANPTIATRRVLTEEGAGCDVFGPGELHIALQSGAKPETISLNGTAKSRDLLRWAIELGTRITIDHPNEAKIIIEEASRLKKIALVRIRTRFPDVSIRGESDVYEGLLAKDAVGRYKTGVPIETGIEIAKDLINCPFVELLGLHCHVGRHRKDLGFWSDVSNCFADAIIEYYKKANGWVPKEIDIGGGFAPKKDPTGQLKLKPESRKNERDDIPSAREYLELITDTIRARLSSAGISLKGMAFEIEPGRAVYQDTSIHITKVHDVKYEQKDDRAWVETDTSIYGFVDSPFEYNFFAPQLANKMEHKTARSFDVVGISCSSDFLAKDLPLPSVEKGDIIAFLNTGAYLEPGSSNFNAMPRPASVMVSGSQAAYIRRPETIDEICSRDCIPEWQQEEIQS